VSKIQIFTKQQKNYPFSKEKFENKKKNTIEFLHLILFLV